MLSKLLESMLAESGLRPINSTQIRPTEELRIHLFNDDQLNNHRIQITDSEDPFRQPGLPEYEHQNPSAHLGEAGTPDGLYACLSTAQRQTITCVGGTPSAVALFSETDVFDVTINNTSYTNQTFEQLQKLLEDQQVELVTLVAGSDVPEEEPSDNIKVVTVAPGATTYVVYGYHTGNDNGNQSLIKLLRTLDGVQTEFTSPFTTMLDTPIEGFDFKINEPSNAADLSSVLNIPTAEVNDDQWTVYRYPIINNSTKQVTLELISLDENIHRFAFI